MKCKFYLLLYFSHLNIFIAIIVNMNNPPKTERKNFKEVLYGVVLRDPYRWLEKDEREVKKWIGKQDAFAHSLLSQLSQRENFEKRLGQLLKAGSIGVPLPKNGFYFTLERKSNEDMAVLYVQKGLKGKKRVLVDANKLSKNKTTTLRRWSPSDDGKLLAYTLSEGGNDQNAVYILDVATGKRRKDFIPAEFYPAMHSGIEWNPDGTGFWYARRQGRALKGEEKLNQKIFYHILGSDFCRDELVFGKNLPKDQFPSVSVSSDGGYLLISVDITSGKIQRNDLYLKDLRDPKGVFKPIIRNIDAEFLPWIHRGALYIATNHKASNRRLIKVSLDRAMLGIKYWKTIIPEGRYPQGDVFFIKDRIFLHRLENAHSVIQIYGLNGKFISNLTLPIGSAGPILGEGEGEELFFGFTSFMVPQRIYRFDLMNKKLILLNELKIKGVNLKIFEVEQVWFTSKDRTRIPMFLVYKKGMCRTGKTPTLLYGYGGFGVSLTPEYSPTTMAFLEKGGLYAMPNLRGGGEFGERWHQAGTKERKQNVFNDFIAAAEWLIKNKYTDQKHLAAFGWSNGGLLAGAMITQRPDLFKAIAVGAPVIDMLRYHKFYGGRYWIPDYGDPDSAKAFHYLLKYSPYHHVKENTSYPAIIIVTAEGDDRVHPAHAYKFAARLQEANNSQNPIIVTIERKAGHGGAASISNFIRQHADIYGFIAWQLGMK